MAQSDAIVLNSELNKKSENFFAKMNSEMNYKSELASKDLAFDWIEEIDYACPYIDTTVRIPKVALIKEEDIVILEKAKKTSVATVKHLARNTQNIDIIDEESLDVTPSKLLIERYEETFNTYENRFIYSLIDLIARFVMQKESMLDDLKVMDDKRLEYAGETIAGKERINIELKVTANDIAKDTEDLDKRVEEARKKIKRIKQFLASWRRTECIMALDKAHVRFIIPPLKKTNLILKNANFQVANKLWDFLQNYDDNHDKNTNEDDDGTNVLKSIMDDAFLMNYYVLETAPLDKKERKAKLAEYGVVMIHQQIKRVISLLLDSGLKLTEQEILDMILNQLRNEKAKKQIDSSDIKNRFKSEIEEYLEKTQNYL